MSEAEDIPGRPYVPPVLIALLVVLGVEWVCAECGDALTGTTSMLVAAGALGLVAAIVSVVLMVRERQSWSLVVGLCLACATCAALVAISAVEARVAVAERLATTPVSQCSIEVVSDPSQTTSGFFSRGRVTLPGGDAGEVWLSSNDAFERGDVLTCVGRFKGLEDDDWGRSSAMRGISGTVTVTHVMTHVSADGLYGALLGWRRSLVAGIEPASSDERALLAGCILGWRRELKSSGIEDVVSASGLSHLVAVSGSHLALLAALVTSLLSGFRIGPRARSALVILLCAAYVVLTGLAPSAVRSCAMLVAAEGARLWGRRAHPLSAVALVALVMVLVDPRLVGDVGFLLSVGTVCALCLFTTYVDGLIRVLAHGWMQAMLCLVPRQVRHTVSGKASSAARTVRMQASSSLVAHTASMPIVMATFGTVSVVGPLANVLVAPVFSACMLVGLLAVALSSAPVVGPVLLGCSDVCMGAFLALARWCSALPLSSLPVSVGAWVVPLGIAAAAVLLVWWPRPERPALLAGGAALLVVTGAFVFLPWWLAPARVVVLDIGQGDAILIQDGPHAILVDTGPDGSVVDALGREHVLALDAVVLTHLHADHVGGVDDLVGSLSVGVVYVAQGVDQSMGDELASSIGQLTGSAPSTLTLGDQIHLGGYVLTVVWPEGPVDGDENCDSICLALSYDDGAQSLDAYLTGDAEEDETRTVLAHGGVGDVDFLKVGHHGSAVSVDGEEASTLDPEVSVASAGEGNRYGHPTSECVSTLEEEGSLFLCTKDVGDVCVMPGAEGPRVSCSTTGRGLPYYGDG